MTAVDSPAAPESPVAQSASLCRAIAEAQRWITSIYRLDLDLRAEQFVVDPGTALGLLPPDSPRSGLVVVEEPAELSIGIYIDAADVDDPSTVIEETSHLLYLARSQGCSSPALACPVGDPPWVAGDYTSYHLVADELREAGAV